MAVAQAPENLEMYARLIQELERRGFLNRIVEFLPSNEEIANRKILGTGLTRPEIAVLMAYSKNLLKKAVLESEIPEDAFIHYALESAFPHEIKNRFPSYLHRHRLKREIISTQIANALINEMNSGFIGRLMDETGAQPADVVRAYIIAREVFSINNMRDAVRELNEILDANMQISLFQEINRLVRRSARWFIRNRKPGIDITDTIEQFKPAVQQITDALPGLLEGPLKENFDGVMSTLYKAGVPKSSPLIQDIGLIAPLFSALDIVEAATVHDLDLNLLTAVYFALGTRLDLVWFRDQIKSKNVANHWESLARAAYRDDIDRQQSLITLSIIKFDSNIGGTSSVEKTVERWLKKNKRLTERWQYLVNELKTVVAPDFTMFSLVLRELIDIGHAALHGYTARRTEKSSSGK